MARFATADQYPVDDDLRLRSLKWKAKFSPTAAIMSSSGAWIVSVTAAAMCEHTQQVIKAAADAENDNSKPYGRVRPLKSSNFQRSGIRSILRQALQAGLNTFPLAENCSPAETTTRVAEQLKY